MGGVFVSMCVCVYASSTTTHSHTQQLYLERSVGEGFQLPLAQRPPQRVHDAEAVDDLVRLVEELHDLLAHLFLGGDWGLWIFRWGARLGVMAFG